MTGFSTEIKESIRQATERLNGREKMVIETRCMGKRICTLDELGSEFEVVGQTIKALEYCLRVKIRRIAEDSKPDSVLVQEIENDTSFQRMIYRQRLPLNKKQGSSRG